MLMPGVDLDTSATSLVAIGRFVAFLGGTPGEEQANRGDTASMWHVSPMKILSRVPVLGNRPGVKPQLGSSGGGGS